jgi:hypothetical protein
MARVQMLPEGNGSLTAHNSKSSSLQNSFKLTLENFNFLRTKIHTTPCLKIRMQYSAPRL